MRRSWYWYWKKRLPGTRHVRRLRSADDLEGLQLHDRGVELRLIGHDLRRIGFHDLAGQHQRERLAGPGRRGRAPPPARDGFHLDIHHVGWRLGGAGTTRKRTTATSRSFTRHSHRCIPHLALHTWHSAPHPALRTLHSALVPSAGRSRGPIPAARCRTSSGRCRAAARPDPPAAQSAPPRPASPARGPGAPRASRRESIRVAPVSTSKASTQPDDMPGSSKANAASTSTTNTSCTLLASASSLIIAPGSSNRKSETTGTSEVLREKPLSVALRLPATLQVLRARVLRRRPRGSGSPAPCRCAAARRRAGRSARRR